jgi:hypothetical protein
MMIIEQMLKNAQTPLLHIADVSGSALFQGVLAKKRTFTAKVDTKHRC